MTFAGLLCYAGFSLGFLLERNYYIVGIFYTHLFILVAVFLFRVSHVLELIVKLPKYREEFDDEETLDID